MTKHTRKFSLLFIDDDAELRTAIAHRLQGAGIETETASDGVEAIRRLEARAFDVIVVDMIMPDRDGVETTIEVRKRWPKTAIIAMSGGGRIPPGEFLELGKAFGAHALLPKPFSLGDLLDAIDRARARLCASDPRARNGALKSANDANGA